MSDRERVLREVGRYYTARVLSHGPTARGVDWKSEASQVLRFEQLLRVVGDVNAPFSLLDYGCGYGGLVDHLSLRGLDPDYSGFDISPEMIKHARDRHGGRRWCRFTTSLEDLEPADFVVASGVFNVRLDIPNGSWRDYVLDTIDMLAGLSTEGFAFNVLSLDSDPEHRRPDLFYADPGFFLDHCRRRYSRWVALLQDYGLYEFTMIVRRRGETSWRNS